MEQQQQQPVITEQQQYDRQIRLWGLAAQRRLTQSRVIIVGLEGVGIEICKNIVLAGVGTVKVIDEEIVTEMDLGSQFYLSEEDVGKKTRSEASLPKLSGLNTFVKVERVQKNGAKSLTPEDLTEIDVLVATGQDEETRLFLDNLCLSKGVKFISVNSHGLFSSSFLNLAHHNWTTEVKGEEGAKSTVNEHSRQFPSLVKASQVEWSKTRRAPLAYFAIQLIESFHAHHHRLPIGAEESELLAAEAKTLIEKRGGNGVVDVDSLMKLAGTISSQWNVNFSPVCAIVGGIMGQEVIKVVTGKEEPIFNFFVFDAMESVGAVVAAE